MSFWNDPLKVTSDWLMGLFTGWGMPPIAAQILIGFLGIYVASAIYIALFMIILGKYSPIKSVLLAIAVNAYFFVMFEIWFKVPLYKGSLEPLAFLDY